MGLRIFQPEDTAALIELWQQCELIVPWNDPERDIRRKLDAPSGQELFLVIEDEHDSRIIASAMGGYDGHRGWVNYLAVAPERRGEGHGRALMEALEARLLELGCPKLNLQVRSSNTTVIDFYAALGYRKDEVTSLGKRLIEDD